MICSQMSSVHPPARKSNSIGGRKEKGPKFVPYEPYKAAVTPMVATSKAKAKVQAFQGALSVKGTVPTREDDKEELKIQNHEMRDGAASEGELYIMHVSLKISAQYRLKCPSSRKIPVQYMWSAAVRPRRLASTRLSMEINFKVLVIMLIDFLENFHFSFFARKRWRKCQGWRYGTRYYDSRS